MAHTLNMVAGGSSITTGTLNVTANGSYAAPEGTAYVNVNVNVPSINNGVEHTYNMVPSATINAGDFCYYGWVTIGSGSSRYAFPIGYDRGGSGGTPITCVAKETKTTGASDYDTAITVIAPT